MAPCLPAYLSHQWPFRPFLPVLLNWFFCLHPFLFHTLVLQGSQLSQQPPSLPLPLYSKDPQTWFYEILSRDSLKQSWKMPLRDHWLSFLKQKSPSSLPTPHRGREWCAASNLEDLESKARTGSLAYIWRGKWHLSRCRQLPGYLSVFSSPSVIWLWILPCPQRWPLFRFFFLP